MTKAKPGKGAKGVAADKAPAPDSTPYQFECELDEVESYAVGDEVVDDVTGKLYVVAAIVQGDDGAVISCVTPEEAAAAEAGTPEEPIAESRKLYCFESRQRSLTVVRVGPGGKHVKFRNHMYNTADAGVAERLKRISGVRLLEIVTQHADGSFDAPEETDATTPWAVVPVEPGSAYDMPTRRKSFSSRGRALAFLESLGSDAGAYMIEYRGK